MEFLFITQFSIQDVVEKKDQPVVIPKLNKRRLKLEVPNNQSTDEIYLNRCSAPRNCEGLMNTTCHTER